jgi:uncharacterized protein
MTVDVTSVPRRIRPGRFVLAGLLSAPAAAAAGMLAITPGIAGAATAGHCGGSLTLSVQGTGTASGAPNLLQVTLDLSSSAPSAVGALTANNTATSAVIAALKSGGVAAADLQTSGLSIQAQYATTGTAVSGYAVDDTVNAKLRDLSTAGSLLDAAVTAGGNAVRVDDLHYSVTNPTSLEDKARSMAVHQAVGHASAIASAAGEHLGPICSLTDETSTPTTTGTRRVVYGEPGAGAAIAPASPTVPVQQGTETETDQVKIVYSLAPGAASKHH